MRVMKSVPPALAGGPKDSTYHRLMGPPATAGGTDLLFPVAPEASIPRRDDRVSRLEALAMMIVVVSLGEAGDAEAKHFQNLAIDTFRINPPGEIVLRMIGEGPE